MSKIYIGFKPKTSRSDLRDMITELRLQNAILSDKIDTCMGFLESRNKQIAELQVQLKRAEKRIERLRFELTFTNRALDIVTEKKE